MTNLRNIQIRPNDIPFLALLRAITTDYRRVSNTFRPERRLQDRIPFIQVFECNRIRSIGEVEVDIRGIAEEEDAEVSREGGIE